MKPIRKIIAPGVALDYLETDKFKTNFLSVNFVAPLSDRAASNALIMPILLRGSRKYPTMADISKRLDYLYSASISSRNYKTGDRQVFGLCADMIDTAYTFGGEDIISEVADLVLEILLNPATEKNAFNLSYTEGEKSNLIDEINARIDNKTAYARHRCIQEMCKNEAFGLTETGTAEQVEKLNAESLYENYLQVLKCCPIEIFFVGKCDIDALEKKFASALSALDRTPSEAIVTEVVRSAKEIKRITEDMPVNQGKLSIGLRTGITLHDPDYAAMILFNGIFGGCVTSKLFMNVREKMSLCYYCSSSPIASKGIMIINSGIEVKNREVAEKAIFDQLDAMKAGNFTESEQSSALLALINRYRELSDSAKGLESWYLGGILESDDSTPEETIESLRAVTAEEITAAANKATIDTIYFLNGTLKEGESDE